MDIFKQIYIQDEISFIDRDIARNIDLILNDNVIYQLIAANYRNFIQEYSEKISEFKRQNERYVNLLYRIDARLKESTDKTYLNILNNRKALILEGYEHNRKLYLDSIKVSKEIHQRLNDDKGILDAIEKTKTVIIGFYENMINVGYNFTIGSVFFKEFIHFIFTNRKNQDDKIINHLDKVLSSYLLTPIPLIRDKREIDLTHYKFNPNLIQETISQFRTLFLEFLNEEDRDFDYFFMLGLRHTELSEINNYLNHHAQRFEHDFRFFLRNALENYKYHLQDNQIVKVEKWLEESRVKGFNAISVKSEDKLIKPPEGFKLIPIGTKSQENIKRFFSFLYLETNGGDKPFMNQSDVEEMLRFGFGIYKEPQKYYKVNVHQPKGIIKYCFFKLYASLDIRNNKNDIAIFLTQNFECFKKDQDNLANFKRLITNRKPKVMIFDIESYLP